MSAQASEILGVGAVGLGGHFDWSHLPFLEELPSCEITALADKDQARLEVVRNRLLLPEEVGFTDYRQLLGNEAVQAVVITTGDSSHFGIAQACLRPVDNEGRPLVREDGMPVKGKHVLLEKPAAATAEECAQLPSLFDYAEKEGLRLWVCHPREFGDGPWARAAKLIGNPRLISKTFGVGEIGKLLEVRYDCHYTLPDDKSEQLHTSFADDKMNHNVASLMVALPNVTGFHSAVMLDNTATHYDANMITISDDPNQAGITVRMGGRRSAHKENHDGGVWRDILIAIFEEGELQVEPSLGTIGLLYGKKRKSSLEFNPDTLYDDMFRAENAEFVQAVLDHRRPEPLTRQAKILATAAAILLQQPGFDGSITENAVRGMV